MLIASLAIAGPRKASALTSSQERQYLVAGYGSALPNPAAISAAGGVWIDQIPSMGLAIVKSNNPNFLTLVKQDWSVELAATDIDVKNPEAEPTAEEEAALDEAEAQMAQMEDQAAASGVLPNDMFFFAQWPHLAMGIPEAHNRGITGSGVTVAVVDYGINCGPLQHPDLAPSITNISFVPLGPLNCSQNSDCTKLTNSDGSLRASCDTIQHLCVLPDGSSTGFEDPCEDKRILLPNQFAHGTPIAGIIAALCDNGIGVCGIAPDAKIANYKVGPSNGGSFPTSRLVKAYDLASDPSNPHRADIINASHIVFCENTPSDPSDCRDMHKILQRMSITVFKRGTLLIAAAGNDGKNVSLEDTLIWPAAHAPHVTIVGAVAPCGGALDGILGNDFIDNLTNYSNYGFESNYLVMPSGNSTDGCSYPRTNCRVNSSTLPTGFLNIPCQLWDQIPTTTRKDFKAPGANFPPFTTGYTFFSGTSGSTPHASGLAALWLSNERSQGRDPKINQVAEALLSDLLLVDIGLPGYDELFGFGRGTAAFIQ